MAIKQRGEVEISLAGRTYTMAPTFAFIGRVESQYGPLVRIIKQFATSEWSAVTLVGIVQIALAAESLKPREIAEAMYKGGLLNYVKPVADLLENALTGGQVLEDARGNGEAAAET